MTMPLTKRAVHGILAVLETQKKYMVTLEELAATSRDNQIIREFHFRCDQTHKVCDYIARIIKDELLDESGA